MDNQELQYNDSPGGVLSQQERTCAECGRKFIIGRMDLWAYKLVIKGRTLWFCRYNCVRAGERKLKDAKGRKKDLKSKKPEKEKLEEHLRAGALIADIARKYESSVQSVRNWIKSYSLQGIQGVKKPKVDAIVPDTIPSENIVQDSPTPSEIEQFHTDVKPQELPKVEVDPVITEAKNTELADLTPTPPWPFKTIDEVWQCVHLDLDMLEQLYAAQARKSFRERLHAELGDWVGNASVSRDLES